MKVTIEKIASHETRITLSNSDGDYELEWPLELPDRHYQQIMAYHTREFSKTGISLASFIFDIISLGLYQFGIEQALSSKEISIEQSKDIERKNNTLRRNIRLTIEGAYINGYDPEFDILEKIEQVQEINQELIDETQDIRATLTKKARISFKQSIPLKGEKNISFSNVSRVVSSRVTLALRYILGNGSLSNNMRYDILKRDNYICQLCGRNVQDGIKLEIDHKIPKSRGGSNSTENLWTLCFDCNRGKSAKEL